jgi:hypothetical protein
MGLDLGQDFDVAAYFSQHPRENPANYCGTVFDPAGAAAYRYQLAAWRSIKAVRLAASGSQKPSTQGQPVLRAGQ